MLSQLKSLFDFHPKEQKGIFTLFILLVLTGIGYCMLDQFYLRPSLHSEIPSSLLDSLKSAHMRHQLEWRNDSLTVSEGEFIDYPSRKFQDSEFIEYTDETQSADRASANKFETTKAFPLYVRKAHVEELEINGADSMAWLQVRGIGPYTAKKILQYKQKLGGFQSLEQLKEIYKIDPILFDTCGTRFSCNIDLIQKINVNTCEAVTLMQHPYLSKSQANAIVAYRKMHGPYMRFEDLNKVALLDQATLTKIQPYLILQ